MLLMIQTSNLQIGMTVKNYKELCELLGEPVKTGEAKKTQLKNWSCYFEFERPKYKHCYIILDIYEEPLEKENDKRSKGNNNIYTKFIETILINYLSRQEGNVKTFTRRNWWELLGMVNERYNKLTTTQLQKIDKSFTEFEINHFYQRCNKKLDSILTSALNNMKHRRLIEWEYQTVIVYNENKYFVANDDEVESILKIENNILNNTFGFDDVRQIYATNQQKQFYSLVNKTLFDEYGYNKYYKRIKIIYNQENMISALPRTEIQLQKLMLNNNIVDYLNKEAKRINNNWIEKYYNNETDVYPYYYLKAQQLLVDELIKPLHPEDALQYGFNQIVELQENSNMHETLFSVFDFP